MGSSPSPSVTFVGYAIVSADGFIADDEGGMPDSLRFEADWSYFQAALDVAALTLLGRRTHEAAPNVRGRRRLVVSSRVRGLITEDERTWRANPAEVEAAAACSAIAGPAANVAVLGGTGVFDWILAGPGYSAFHLSLARDVVLGEGRPIFRKARHLKDATALLEGRGLALRRRSWLDREVGLELLVYEAD